jgi:hypothetical protein
MRNSLQFCNFEGIGCRVKLCGRSKVEAMVMKEWLTIKRDLDSLVRGGRRKTERFACRSTRTTGALASRLCFSRLKAN